MAMATKSVMNTMDMAATYRLFKDDIPGANLIGKSPDDLILEQLKWWLECCGAHRSGRIAKLVQVREAVYQQDWGF